MELIENEYCELKSILTKDIKKEDKRLKARAKHS